MIKPSELLQLLPMTSCAVVYKTCCGALRMSAGSGLHAALERTLYTACCAAAIGHDPRFVPYPGFAQA